MQEVVHQQRDVLAPLAQRRKLNRDDVQPVVEVLAEAALAHHGGQVGIGCGQDAHIGPDRFRPAQTHEGAFLDHTQQLGLRLGADRADFVEEQRALVGHLEQALLRGHRAGEGAADMAEQQRFQQVHRH